jgi:hypothetical protein
MNRKAQMTEEKTEASESSPLTDSRLRLVYVAGIALNVVALSGAVMAGEWLFAVTFGIVIVYLCFRYWLIVSS